MKLFRSKKILFSVSRPKAFTLSELMVVILIVAILAAVAIPIMKGRIDAAKWSEGKAIAGTLASSLRAYVAQYEENGSYGVGKPTLLVLGFNDNNFDGTYFSRTNYSWQTEYIPGAIPPLTFTINITAPPDIRQPQQVQLDHTGKWTEI